jgi:O-antigen/teichoic acid export membrane protein
MNLKKRAISGLKWSTSARIGRQVLQFITLIIFARLLNPEDFGLMASALVVIGFVSVFRDLGLSAALIQKQELSDELFSSVFWLSVTTGLIMMLMLIIFSPYIADFYNANALVPILQVLSLSFLFSGFSAVQQALLEKELQFKTISKIELFATFLSAATGITMAILKFGIWSLVLQNLVFTFTVSCLFWIRLSKRPRFFFKWREIKSILNFSANLAGFNILNYFVRNADYILIQKFLGEQQLGYYTLAYRLMLYPLQNVTAVITRVMFPVLSKIQQDNDKFRDIYIKLANSIALLTFPLMLGLIAVSDNFVLVVFGTKWEPVTTLILILAPLGLLQSIYTPAGIIFQAKGRTDWWFRWGVLTGVLFVSAFWIGLGWGIIGVAMAYLIVNVITIYPGLAIPFKLIRLKTHNFLLSFSRTFFISSIMFLFVIAIHYVSNIYIGSTSSLIVSVISGILIYIALSFQFNREKIKYVVDSIRN